MQKRNNAIKPSKEFCDGILVAIEELRAWRELKISVFNHIEYTNREDALRELKNTLNLLETIESKLRAVLGESPSDIFRTLIEYSKRKEQLLKSSNTITQKESL